MKSQFGPLIFPFSYLITELRRIFQVLFWVLVSQSIQVQSSASFLGHFLPSAHLCSGFRQRNRVAFCLQPLWDRLGPPVNLQNIRNTYLIEAEFYWVNNYIYYCWSNHLRYNQCLQREVCSFQNATLDNLFYFHAKLQNVSDHIVLQVVMFLEDEIYVPWNIPLPKLIGKWTKWNRPLELL